MQPGPIECVVRSAPCMAEHTPFCDWQRVHGVVGYRLLHIQLCKTLQYDSAHLNKNQKYTCKETPPPPIFYLRLVYQKMFRSRTV